MLSTGCESGIALFGKPDFLTTQYVVMIAYKDMLGTSLKIRFVPVWRQPLVTTLMRGARGI